MYREKIAIGKSYGRLPKSRSYWESISWKLTVFFQASRSDLPDLKEMAKKVIINNYTAFLGSDLVKDFIDSRQSDQEIEDGIANCTIISLLNMPIGFAITKQNRLHLLMIDDAYQNKGYGTKLLAYIEKILWEKYSVIELQSFEKNIRANEFYLKNHWSVLKIEEVEGLELKMMFFQKSAKQTP